MSTPSEAIIIGAGHAGLSTSYCLTHAGVSHLVLEQARVGETWRAKRWDSFTLVTPNWMCMLPGYPYAGDNPDGFMARDEVVAYLEGYARSFAAPVREGVRVSAITQRDTGYRVETDQEVYEVPVVVVATGFFEQPKIPAVATKLPADILQIHSSQYKNPAMLPPGAVLVVGSGQSGCQIAEELHRRGRRVYLCTGTAGRLLRRYRGKDGLWWEDKKGGFDQTVDTLTSPHAKFAGNPHVTGAGGGHTINLHRLAGEGVVLLGHFRGIQGERIILAPDLRENLAKADKSAADFRQAVDDAVRQAGLPFPPPDASNTDEYDGDDGYRQGEILELAVRDAGISAVIWAAGFATDYSFLQLPAFDAAGYPVQERGVSRYGGLYFMGVHYQYKKKSDLFYGVGEDAAYVAEAIAAQLGKRGNR